ncbi:MAG: hypothetical protein F4229_00830 [Gammaproteobacteria bacterium]|nr:hypothetical protein [Gammaproteobacteria bacterium]
MTSRQAIERYLDRYGEPEAQRMPPLAARHEHVLTVPCYDEPPECVGDLLGRLDASALVILVINAPSDADTEARHRTEAFWRALGGVDDEPFHFSRWRQQLDLLAVNRAARDRLIPRRQGVGLARKIAADMASALIAAERITSPWIHMTDADAELPADYFAHMPARPGCALHPYRHEAPPELADAMRLYELHLRYYVNRLRWAGSPYAFHTIGSTVSIHADTYVKVRGVPKRNAGEDFHLLNKVAKVAPIHRLSHPEICLKARLSTRVPFGTGPALRRMTGDDRPLSYAPESFIRLAEVIAHIDRAAPLSNESAALLEELGYPRFRTQAQRQHRRPETLRKATHEWFDGLRTLRFIHLARRFHPDQSLAESLNRLFGAVDHLARLKALERDC